MWALFHTKNNDKLTTAQLERLVFCNCNLKLLERSALSLESTHVDIDKLDMEKVNDIPDIPQADRDLYSLLYEGAIAPIHDTRVQRRRRARGVSTSTSVAAARDTHSSSSSSYDDSQESDETEDATDPDA